MLRRDVPLTKVANYVDEVVQMVVKAVQETAEQRARADAAFKLQVDQIDAALDGAQKEHREAAACVDAQQAEIDTLHERVALPEGLADRSTFEAAHRRLEKIEAERKEAVARHAKAMETHEKQLEHLEFVQNLVKEIDNMIDEHSAPGTDKKKTREGVAVALIQLQEAEGATVEAALKRHGVEPTQPNIGSELDTLVAELAKSFEAQQRHVEELHRVTKDMHRAHMDRLAGEETKHKAHVESFNAKLDAAKANAAGVRGEVEQANARRAECESAFRKANLAVELHSSKKAKLEEEAEAELSHYDTAIEQMEEQVEMGREILGLIATALDDAHVYKPGQNPVREMEAGLPSATGVQGVVAATERNVEDDLLAAAEEMMNEVEAAEEDADAMGTGVTGMADAEEEKEEIADRQKEALAKLQRDIAERRANEGPLPEGAEEAAETVAAGEDLSAVPGTGATGTAKHEREMEIAKRRKQALEETERLREVEEDSKLRSRMAMGLAHETETEIDEDFIKNAAPLPEVVTPVFDDSDATGDVAQNAKADSKNKAADALQGASTAAEAGQVAAAQSSAEDVADESNPGMRDQIAGLVDASKKVGAPTGAAAPSGDVLDRILDRARENSKGQYMESTVGIVRAAVRFERMNGGDFDALHQWGLARAVARTLGTHPDAVHITKVVEVSRKTGDVVRTVLGEDTEERAGKGVAGYKGTEGATVPGAYVFRRHHRRLLSLRGKLSGDSKPTLSSVEGDATDELDLVVSFDVQTPAKDVKEATKQLETRVDSGVFGAVLKNEGFQAAFSWDAKPVAVYVPVMLPNGATGSGVAVADEEAKQPKPEEEEPEEHKNGDIVETDEVVEGPVPKDCPACVNKTVTKKVVEYVVRTVNTTVRVTEPDYAARAEAASAVLDVDQLRAKIDEMREDASEKSAAEKRAHEAAIVSLEAKLEEQKRAAVRKAEAAKQAEIDRLERKVEDLRETVSETRDELDDVKAEHESELESIRNEASINASVAIANARVDADADARARADDEVEAGETASQAALERVRLEEREAASEKLAAADKRWRETLEKAVARERAAADDRVETAQESAAERLEAYKKQVRELEEARAAMQASNKQSQKVTTQLRETNAALQRKLEEMRLAASTPAAGVPSEIVKAVVTLREEEREAERAMTEAKGAADVASAQWQEKMETGAASSVVRELKQQRNLMSDRATAATTAHRDVLVRLEKAEKRLRDALDGAIAAEAAAAASAGPSSNLNTDGDAVVNQDVRVNQELADAENEAANARKAEAEAEAEAERLDAEIAAAREAAANVAQGASPTIEPASSEGAAAGGDLDLGGVTMDSDARAFFMMQNADMTESRVEAMLNGITGATGLDSPFGDTNVGQEAVASAPEMTGTSGLDHMRLTPGLDVRVAEEEKAAAGAAAADRVEKQAEAYAKLAMLVNQRRNAAARIQEAKARAEAAEQKAEFERVAALKHLQELESKHFEKKSALEDAQRAKIDAAAAKEEARREAEHKEALAGLAKAEATAALKADAAEAHHERLSDYHKTLVKAANHVNESREDLSEDVAEAKSEAERIISEARARAARIVREAKEEASG